MQEDRTPALITASDAAQCWGGNDHGKLGDGTLVPRLTPTDVIGLQTEVATISGGNAHTCATLEDDGARCWGRNEYGQLGDDTTDQRLTPVDVVGLPRA